MKEKKKGLHLEIDNLAIPEVRMNEEDVPEEETGEDTIDYSGAIPEIHIKRKKKEQ